MNSIWIVSMVLQWAVILALCLLVFSLVRQLGEINLRLDGKARPAEPEPEKIFQPYSPFPEAAIPLVNGGTFHCGGKRPVPGLIVYFSPSCASCAEMPDAIREFSRHILPEEFNLLVVLKSHRASVKRYVAERNLGALAIAVEEDLPAGIRSSRSPFAVGVTPGGAVAASGSPKTLSHLLEMAQAARAMAELTPSHSRRKHDWGESAPYWNLNVHAKPSTPRETPQLATRES